MSARALKDNGFETGVLLYDGLMVKLAGGQNGAPHDGECIEAVVTAAEKAVLDGLGFHMNIEHKDKV